MKTKLNLLVLIILFLGTIASQAIIIFQDNFSEYAAGPLGTNVPTWFAPPGDASYATNVGISASGTGSAIVSLTPSASIQEWAVFTNGIPGYSVSLPSSGPGMAITNITATCYYFPSNGPVAALYASFTINVTGAITNSTGDYIAMFLGTNFSLHPRIFVCTNLASSGAYTMAIDNTGTPSSTGTATNSAEIIAENLAYGTTYNVVFKQVLASGLSTLWVGPSNPTNETQTLNSISPSAISSVVTLGGGITYTYTTGTNTPSFSALCGFGFHCFTSSGTGGSVINIGSLVCGTTFEDVVPASAGSNPAFIAVQPTGVTNFLGSPATLSVVAGGDTNGLSYQWSGPLGIIAGATSSSYTISSLVSGSTGSYSVVVSNVANVTGITSSIVSIGVLSGSAVPTISGGPTNATVVSGGSATFVVSASDGNAPMTYQWYYGASMIANATNSSLPMAAISTNQAGLYHVVVANANGPSTSTNATLTVTLPTVVSIAYLHSLLDNTNFNTNGSATVYAIIGTNNTWENLTTPGNSEFDIQDGTGGMNIFWSGAASITNQPPAGAVVEVVGPLSEFDGIQEMAPVFGSPFNSVTVLSTNGILPTPMPLPFDPTVLGNPTNMQKHLMSCYFVASNVFLDLASGPTFGDDANEPLTNGSHSIYTLTLSSPNGTNQQTVTNFGVTFTNQIGQTNDIFYNDHIINFIGGQKPIGPCTVYGVLSIHTTSTPYTSGYELVATRLQDIIPALVWTNVISNIVRYGDLPTNSFTQNVLQPGESLTMNVIASDPGGGTVTLSGLTGSGTWSAVTGNGTATAKATYTYTATVGAEGTTDTPNMTATFSSSGFTSTYVWTIYVPTVPEQSMRITEVLPFAASDTNSPAYNPLQRGLPETDAVSYDQYVEIVNASSSAVSINHWTIGNGGTALHQFSGGESLSSSNAALIYGGPLLDSDPPNTSLAQFVEPASTGNGLTLTSASGVITLSDNSGNLVDRVAYPVAGSVTLNPTNFNWTGQSISNYPICSYSRYPNLNSPLVPQSFINTNYVTPGTQYDGGSWSSPTTLPTGVTGIVPTASGTTTTLRFTADTVDTTTLWMANGLLQPFEVITGGVFTNSSGTFTITNTPSSQQYYFITKQPGYQVPVGN